MASEDQAGQQRRRRLRKGSRQTLGGTIRVAASNCCAYDSRRQHPIAASLWAIFAVILLSPMFDVLARVMGVGFVVFAAPCMTGNSTAVQGGERAASVSVSVTPATGLNLTIFNCEGGNFDVCWSGAVNVTETIHIGRGTTVHIQGNTNRCNHSDAAYMAESGSSTTGDSGNTSTGHDELNELTTILSIPRGPTSAAVRTAPPDTSGDFKESPSFGPIFFVDGGELIIENMAIRGGLTTNSSDNPTDCGAGIHAKNSTVKASSCEFEDNIAESAGGGVFGVYSTLEMVDSVFRRCEAGSQGEAGDEDVNGAGGAISGEGTDMLIVGCLFEECYASKKGGGIHQNGGGKMSVRGSVFFNNSAGSINIKDEDAVGEGGALYISTCDLSFDGQGACGVNSSNFAYNHVGLKGGAVSIGRGESPSHVEFHLCTVTNSITGAPMESDPQGEGGVFDLAPGTRLHLSDGIFIDNYSGNQGGVIAISSLTDRAENMGGTITLVNSTFESNAAGLGSAGVAYIGEFSTLDVVGEGNVFEANTCGDNGGVFRGMTNTTITVEGGVFINNEAGVNGGVISTKGTTHILGGEFRGNCANDRGAVILSDHESATDLAGGVFMGNYAADGAVVFVQSNSRLSVSGGELCDNEASKRGGAFCVTENGSVKITGGTFSSNKAHSGGFLFKEGQGSVSCQGASILLSEGVDGGAVYAADNASIHWSCDLKNSSALAGPALYALDNATVVLQGISLVDNHVARGSVVFVVNSDVKTYQVEFKDTSNSLDRSAVQVDGKSSYMAEDTSFEGFEGEAVVFSEGLLFLDDCDFSRCTASQLVYAEPQSKVVIRNTVLGDNNYAALKEASMAAGEIPTADSLINANMTCRDERDGGGTPPSNLTATVSICSQGSVCLEGDLGVYCECYFQRSTSKERCVDGSVATLDLACPSATGKTFYPDIVHQDLVLWRDTPPASFSSSDSSTNAASTSSEDSASSGGSTMRSTVAFLSDATNGSSTGGYREKSGNALRAGSQNGLIWNVSSLPELSVSGQSMMNWTIFPSSGLLLPGKSIHLRVATLPGPNFDGTTSVTFDAVGMRSNTTSSIPINVTFFHCKAGEVWASSNDSDDGDKGCLLCTALVKGETGGVKCSEPGATTEALPVMKGFWRASLDVVFIRKCRNKAACKGGTHVSDVQQYCNDGYEGPVCTVCASGYGRGAANGCHLCTPGFKAVMYAVLVILAMLALVVTALLAVYLMRGRGAVSSTMASTRESVRIIQRRGSGFLLRSGDGGVTDFSIYSDTGSSRSRDLHETEIDELWGVRSKKSSASESNSVRSSSGPETTSATTKQFLEGGTGRGILALSLTAVKKSRFGPRAKPVGPHSAVKVAGFASLAPVSLLGSPPSPTSPGHDAGETSRDASSHRDDVDASGTTAYTHEDTSTISGQLWTSDLGAERALAGPLAPRVGLKHSTGNIWQPQLSLERGSQREVEGQGSRKNRAKPHSEGDGTDKGEGDNRPATKVGNMLMELPLSKLKIVIVVWQISAAEVLKSKLFYDPEMATKRSILYMFVDLLREDPQLSGKFSNITNVGYPPIYEKFLSIIGVFSLDLSWIFSAACLTMEVSFFDKLLMVTIGPLVVLALLGVTFHIGARPAKPEAIHGPTTTQTYNKPPSDTNVDRATDAVGTVPVLRRAETSDTSSEDASGVTTLPRLGPALQRSRPNEGSGDAIMLSRTAHLAIKAGAFVDQHRPARDETKSSDTNDPAASFDATTDDHQDRTVGHVDEAPSPASPGPNERPFVKRLRSLRSLLDTGTGHEADPEKDRLGELFARHTTMTLILLYLVYSQVSTVVFQTFACEEFPEVSKSYLRADQRIECYSATHTAYRTYAGVMIFLYPLGIPGVFYFLLSQQGSSINPPTDKVVKELRGTDHVVREKIKERSTDLSIAPTSFLWNPYYPNRYYFEVFECLRRLVLTGLMVFLAPDTPGQVAYGCLFAFASLLAFELQRPHIDALELQLYRTGCLVIFFTNFLALMIKAEVADEHSRSSAIYSIVLIMANVMFFLSIWANTWATIKTTFSRRGFQGAVMGVDVVGENAVDNFLGLTKNQMRQNTSLGDVAIVSSHPEEERPAWDSAPVDLEAGVDSQTSTR